MVCSFAEAYHWPLKDIFCLTMPQIIMMNHAAHINGKKFDARMNKSRGGRVSGNVYDAHGNEREKTLKEKWGDDPKIAGETKLSEVSQDFGKLVKYLNFDL